MIFAVRVGWRRSARGVFAVGVVGLIVLGMVVAWVSPERLVDGQERVANVGGVGTELEKTLTAAQPQLEYGAAEVLSESQTSPVQIVPIEHHQGIKHDDGRNRIRAR